MNEPFDPLAPAAAPIAAAAPAPVTAADTLPERPFGTPVATSPFLPVLILSLVMLGWFAFQATQLRIERDAMRSTMAGQDKQVVEAKQLRDSLDAIARGTAQLADGGNPGARLIVAELKKRGVTISPDQPTAAPTTPGSPEPTRR